MIYSLLLLVVHFSCCYMESSESQPSQTRSFLERRGAWVERSLAMYDRERSLHDGESDDKQCNVAFVQLRKVHKNAIYSKLLECTKLSSVLCELIVEYIASEVPQEKIKLSNKSVLHLSFESNARICAYSAGDDEACLIDEKTSMIVQEFDKKTIFSRQLPGVFLDDQGSCTEVCDFDKSCDGVSKAMINLFGQAVLFESSLNFGDAWMRRAYQTVQPRHSYDRFLSVRFSPNGKCMLIGGTDGTVYIIDVKTVKTLFCLNHHAAVTALTAHENGSSLLVGLRDGSIYRWEGLFLNSLPELARMKIDQEEREIPSAPIVSHASSGTWCERNALNCLADVMECWTGISGCTLNWRCIRSALSCVVRCPCYCVYNCYDNGFDHCFGSCSE